MKEKVSAKPIRGKVSSIEEYIKSFPLPVQEKLNLIRAEIKKKVPLAEEKISYGIPAYFLNSKQLIYFAAFKNHISIYPVPSNEKSLEKDFSKYKTSGKGTIQFPVEKNLPLPLIRKIIRFLEKRNIEKYQKPKSKKR